MLPRTMRIALPFLAAVLLSTACASTKSAEAAPASAPPAAVAPVAADVKKPGEAMVGDRTTCPVSGETFTVATDSPKLEHDGKTYFFCCEDCVAEFKADPAKFLAKLAAQ